jgi:linoleate 9S-lipoxygenase
MEVFNDENESKKRKIKGTVVLMKKNVLDFNDFHASFLDRVHELLGQGVSLQLISAVNVDPGELLSFCLVGLCYVFLSLHVFFFFLIY